MTTILGIVGSARAWGNSELMARQVLLGAQAEGARTRLLRLTDLRLEPCTGCMRCVIGGQPCPLDDDMAWLLETVKAASGVVLAAPTYWLGPAAAVKLVLDRLLMVAGRVDLPLRPLRPAVTIATAGLEGWRGITLPILNALVAGLGFRPIDSLIAVAPGPGEVLLDEDLMAQALGAGQRLGRGELTPSCSPPGVCPICRCDAFVLRGNCATCPICGRQATVEMVDGQVRLWFDPVEPDQGAVQRWTPEGLRAHMVDWVQATGPRFMAMRDEIKARRAAYRRMEAEWILPPEVGSGRGGGGR